MKIKNFNKVKVGDTAVDANGDKFKVIAIGNGKDYEETLSDYDESGAIGDMNVNPKSYGITADDFDELELIAVRNGSEKMLFTYDPEGAVVYESNISEASEIDIDNHQWALISTGGSIGSKGSVLYIPKQARVSETSDDKEKLESSAKRLNASLSPGEKKYYGIKYYVVEIKNKKHFVMNESNTFMLSSIYDKINEALSPMNEASLGSSESFAKKCFGKNPDFKFGKAKDEDEFIKCLSDCMTEDGLTKVQIKNMLNDEDFIPEVMQAYKELQK